MNEIVRRRGPSKSSWTTDPVPTDPILGSPGYYAKKLVRGGVEVPCRLWFVEDLDEDGCRIGDTIYYAEIGDDPCSPYEPDGWPWRRISEEQWRFMKDDAAWARQYAPDSPKAQPNRPATESPKLYI